MTDTTPQETETETETAEPTTEPAAEPATEPAAEPTDEAAGYPAAGTEPHNAVSDLLNRLRLDVSAHHLVTVFDWLKEQAGDKADAKEPTEPPAASQLAADTPSDQTTGGASTEGASSPIASGESTPVDAPADPTQGAQP